MIEKKLRQLDAGNFPRNERENCAKYRIVRDIPHVSGPREKFQPRGICV
jgi:hypothetical protein